MTEFNKLHSNWLRPIIKTNELRNKLNVNLEELVDIDLLEKNEAEINNWKKLKYDKDFSNGNILDEAIESNNLTKVKWLVKNNCGGGILTFSSAARNGNRKIIDILIHYGYKFDYFTFANACIYSSITDDLTNLEHLRSCGCDWGECISQDMFIIKKNKLVIDWLKNNKCVWKCLYN